MFIQKHYSGLNVNFDLTADILKELMSPKPSEQLKNDNHLRYLTPIDKAFFLTLFSVLDTLSSRIESLEEKGIEQVQNRSNCTNTEMDWEKEFDKSFYYLWQHYEDGSSVTQHEAVKSFIRSVEQSALKRGAEMERERILNRFDSNKVSCEKVFTTYYEGKIEGYNQALFDLRHFLNGTDHNAPTPDIREGRGSMTC